MEVQPSGTVTLVFTDIEGSTRLLSELGRERYLDALTEHRERIRTAFARFDGYEVDYEGDSFFYAFQSAVAAVSAVREGMRALGDGPIRMRVGIHTGEPGLDPPKYVGLDVHRAARIMACAHGGQAVLSQATRELLEDPGWLRDLGEHRLKDLSAPIRLYQLGEGEFPTLRSLYRTNLPVPATPFLGRGQELAEVASMLERDDVRLLTLTGPGGTGKTRLALQAAAESADRYPGGVWWVPLAPLRDRTLLLPTVAQALEVKEQPGQDLSETLTTRLAGTHTLLLLDNVEHLLPDAAAAVTLLRDIGGPQILVTSRERLQVTGEQLYPVPSLVDSDAAALFAARARQLDPAFKPAPAVTTLCERLDNLPLAIELAAARTSLFSPEQLIVRLEQRLPLLTGGPPEVPDRQRTLRSTIAWSHDLLEPEERALFAKLAVFAAGCTLESAEDVCGADIDVLQSLVGKSLLRLTGERFWMLETIREFAADQLDARTEEAARTRHATHFLALAEVAAEAWRGSDQPTYLERLAQERDNMSAALRWLDASRDDEGLARLAVALYQYWIVCGPLTEARFWLDRAEERTAETAPPLRRKVLGTLAFVELLQRDVASARAHAEAGLVEAQKSGDSDAVLAAMNFAAQARVADGDAEGAHQLFSEGIALAREAENDYRLAILLHNLGEWAFVRGEVHEARARSGESSVLIASLGNSHLASSSHLLLAMCDLSDRDLESCTQRLQQALSTAIRLHDPIVLRGAVHILAGLEVLRQNAAVAAHLLGVADALDELSGSRTEDAELVIRAHAEQLLDAAPEEVIQEARAAGRRASFDDAAAAALASLMGNLRSAPAK